MHLHKRVQVFTAWQYSNEILERLLSRGFFKMKVLNFQPISDNGTTMYLQVSTPREHHS